MELIDIDFRYDWTSLTLNALETGFESLRKRNEEYSWFDGIWQKENAEAIFGVAFVVSQAYILGVVEDVNKNCADRGKMKLSKMAYYSDDPLPLQNGVSRILLINSIANYYKHHDEWGIWPTNPTTQTLANVGILENTEFPCCVAATLLCKQDGFENLENFLLLISEWRKYILFKYI
jgi:hypothetical protein